LTIQTYPPSLGRCLERIQRQIDDHLTKSFVVAQNPNLTGAVALQSDAALIGVVLEQVVDFVRYGIEVHRLSNKLSGPRKLHEVFKDMIQPPDLVPDQLQRF